MTIRPLSRDEVRNLDRVAADEYLLPTLILMENAGRGAATWLRSRLKPGSSIYIACGPGNNGGDGGVVARHLDAWGFKVRVVWFAERETLAGDALAQFQILERSKIDQTLWPKTVFGDLDGIFQGADWVVDGLLGTGLTRPVAGQLRDVIESMNRSGRPILALDLPSGLDADSGEPQGATIRARATATFVAPKLGFTSPVAREYLGEVEVVELGLPRRLLEPYQTHDEG